jgi:hypothetical protein
MVPNGMAYGKGLKNVQRRSIPAGKTILFCPPVNYITFLSSRKGIWQRPMFVVDAVFLPEPLISTRTSKEILFILTTVQKSIEKGFNKAYVEKARLTISATIDQVESKYFNCLYGGAASDTASSRGRLSSVKNRLVGNHNQLISIIIGCWSIHDIQRSAIRSATLTA